MKITREKYLKDILIKFNEYQLGGFDLTTGEIRSKLGQIVRDTDEIPVLDEKNIRNFLDINKNIDLLESIKKSDADKYRPLINLFIGKTIKPQKDGVLNIAAILVDFNPRPYSEYFKFDGKINNKVVIEDKIIEVEEVKEETIKYPHEIIIKSKSKLLKLVSISFAFLAIIACLWLVIDLFFKDKLEIQPTTVIYNNYNGNLNYYYTTKKDGEILLYDDSQPNNNNNLKPVTQEVMLAYFKQQQVEVTNEDQKRWFKVNLEETNNTNEIKNTETTVNKVEEKTVEKLKTATKVIINNNSTLDSQISNYFEKFYTKTNNKYIAKGAVTYKYSESSFSKEMVVCELVLTYNVIVYNSTTTFEVNTITTTATGLSKADAKNKAIKKIQFN